MAYCRRERKLYSRIRTFANLYIIRYKQGMAKRTAFLVSCSTQEARTIREQAKLQRRTVSGYVFNIVMRAVAFDERFCANLRWLTGFERSRRGLSGARTTMLLRCSVAEAKRIRTAAKRRDTTISGFMLHTLRRAWKVAYTTSSATPRVPSSMTVIPDRQS